MGAQIKKASRHQKDEAQAQLLIVLSETEGLTDSAGRSYDTVSWGDTVLSSHPVDGLKSRLQAIQQRVQRAGGNASEDDKKLLQFQLYSAAHFLTTDDHACTKRYNDVIYPAYQVFDQNRPKSALGQLASDLFEAITGTTDDDDEDTACCCSLFGRPKSQERKPLLGRERTDRVADAKERARQRRQQAATSGGYGTGGRR